MSLKKNETRPWIKRYGLLLVIGLITIGMYFLINSLMSEKPKPRRDSGFTMVSIPPPPPPPPPVLAPTPPPVQQEPQEEKMIEQAPVTAEDTKQEAAKEEPPDFGTGIKGDGPSDGFGLSGSGNGVIGGGGKGGSRSKWGWYAAEVESSITDALRKNKKTRSARLRMTVRVWPDSTGRIMRAKLNESTGDPALDNAIADEVLTGLQLKTPPPQGMPSSIVLRISARRSK